MTQVEKDIAEVLAAKLDWESLCGKTIAITGANGMLASYVAETLLTLVRTTGNPIRVIALVRNPEKASLRFSAYANDPNLSIVKWDPSDVAPDLKECDILIHAASIPRPDSLHPVDVIAPNVIGTWNLLQQLRQADKRPEQFIYISSGAVYGDRQDSPTPISEDMALPVNQMLPQSCYAESKRAGENICISFMRQYGIPVKVIRYAHTYGPGMDLEHDPRSFVSFIRSIRDSKDIRLTSAGDAVRYFCYATDATIAFFSILLNGKPGEAYNIANPGNGISIRELAELLVSLAPERHLKVVTDTTAAPPGYAPQKIAPCLDIAKLRTLGWQPSISIAEGFNRVLNAL